MIENYWFAVYWDGEKALSLVCESEYQANEIKRLYCKTAFEPCMVSDFANLSKTVEEIQALKR